MEYLLDQEHVVLPKRYSTGESHPLSDLFLYLWTVFVYHEAHEDHEEFTSKLYRLLRFKPRGRYNLIRRHLSSTLDFRKRTLRSMGAKDRRGRIISIDYRGARLRSFYVLTQVSQILQSL